MKSGAGSFALLIFVRIALASPSAPALTFFAPNPTECSGFEADPVPGSPTGSCSVVAQNAVDPVSGVLGVKLSGAMQVVQPTGPVGIAIFSGFAPVVGSSAYSGTIPVSWDFNAASSDGSNVSWSLAFDFFEAGESPPVLIVEGDTTDFDLASGSTVTGTSSITFSDADITSYSISLVIRGQSSANEISVTAGSLEIAPPTQAPEPGSTLLFSGGLIILAAWHRRRR